MKSTSCFDDAAIDLETYRKMLVVWVHQIVRHQYVSPTNAIGQSTGKAG